VKVLRLNGLLILFLAFAFITAAPAVARAQADVTSADIQRLQDSIYDASRDVAQIRSRDAALASQLQSELDDLRDETTYLKVKIRRHESIGHSEYADIRDRIENVRSRARGDSSGRYSSEGTRSEGTRSSDGRSVPPSSSPRITNPNEVPVGTEFDVRLQNQLSSATAQVEDKFEATTLVDLRDENNHVVVPAGSVMRGVVSSVNKAGHIERKGSITVAFDRITINGRSYPMRATVTQALESEGIKGEKEKIGIGAGAGAILGAILGGAKGALAGILIGGGGTIAATEGKDVELPVGTVLRVRMDSALNLAR
jgi:hypothetical protein